MKHFKQIESISASKGKTMTKQASFQGWVFISKYIEAMKYKQNLMQNAIWLI